MPFSEKGSYLTNGFFSGTPCTSILYTFTLQNNSINVYVDEMKEAATNIRYSTESKNLTELGNQSKGMNRVRKKSQSLSFVKSSDSPSWI